MWTAYSAMRAHRPATPPTHYATRPRTSASRRKATSRSMIRLDALSANEKLPEAVRNAIDHLKTNVGTHHHTAQRPSIGAEWQRRQHRRQSKRYHGRTCGDQKLAQQAATSVSGIKTDYESQLKPQLDDIATSITSTTTALNATAADLKGALGNLNGTTKTADKNLTAISSVLDSTADSLAGAGKKTGRIHRNIDRCAEQRRYERRQRCAQR